MTSQSAHAAPVSGLSLLIDWANGQDHWVRKLVGEVVEIRRRLSDERIDGIYDLLLREKELAEGDPVHVEALFAGAASSSPKTAIRLGSLGHVENVNALAPNQEIEFHPRLTICFGENASGKTGYVRILKRAAAVRTAEPVLPNVLAGDSGGTPSAKIKVIVGEEGRAIEWHGEQGVESLTRIDVFDARAAVLHLTADLTYSYTPAELSFFPLVKDAIERVQAKLQAARDERLPRANPFVNRFQHESQLYPMIEGLGSSTDLQELEALAEVSEEEATALPGLREKVEALRSGSVREQLARVEQSRATLARALETAEVIVALDRDAYAGAITASRAARAGHERATREALAGEEVPGILSETWKEFIEAAEGYIREMGVDPYPAPGEACAYCRQPLGDAAVSLLRKYRDYCNDALRKAVEQARERVRTLGAPVRDLPLDGLERELDSLAQALADPGQPPQAIAIAQEVIAHGRVLRQRLQAEEDCPPPPQGLGEAPAILRTAVAAGDATVADLRKQGEERERALADEQARVRQLEALLTLRDLIPAIRDHVKAARWADRAGSFLRPFQGVKRSLTETSKQASAEVMNRDFQRRFEAESQALRAPRVTLDFPGRDGEGRRKKLLTRDHGLGEILSEGEQKVVALADFLAEASLKPDRSPIVLDDPVTSLDHKRLQHVVDRVVELSRDRQIVVFTHDIWFAAELLSRFEREPKECAFFNVAAEDGRVGGVTRGSHPRTDTFKDRSKRVQRLIEGAERESGETRQAMVEQGYSELRGACEVLVEKELLKGVTERYRPNVRMTTLDQIRCDRLPSAFAAITPIFERCCRMPLHSQPLQTLGVQPTLDDLKQDWESLRAAREEYLR